MINVKGKAAVDAELVFARHGPVIYSDAEQRRAYAVRSYWLEPGMAPYFGSVSYMSARNFTEFRRAMLHWGAPTENQVYADVKGNIGWIPGGLAAIRPNWDGLMPVPGDGRYEWTGFWSGDKLPAAFNPASGYVTTSNDMNLPADYPYQQRKLGFEWADGARHARIDEVLKSLARVTIEDSMRLQNDVTSIPARRLVTLLAALNSAEPKTKAALDLLRGWDAVERADSPQAALMEVWISRHLGRGFLEASLPRNAAAAIQSPDIAVMLEALENPERRLGSHPDASAAQKRERVLLASLTAAYNEMEKLLGANAKAWRWGSLHQSLPEHPLAEAVGSDLRAKLQPAPIPFTARLDQVMNPGGVAETITVSGASPLVDVTNTATRTELTREALEVLPTTRDGLKAFMGQVPGARPNLDVGASSLTDTVQFRIYGQSAQSWPMLEGVLIGGATSEGAGGAHVNFNSVEGTRVQTVASNAEMPRRGLLVDAILKSGGNEFHGDAVAYGSSGRFEGSNIDEALRAAGVRGAPKLHTLWDVSGNLGGRIIRNKLWFFGAGRNEGTGSSPIIGGLTAWPRKWCRPSTSARCL